MEMMIDDTPLMNSLSPLEEVLAYETLWAMDGMTEKKLSELFTNNKRPSDVLREKNGFLEQSFRKKVLGYIEQKLGQFSVSVYGDYQYPIKLREAQYPVELFYYKGDLTLVDSPCISVVGSRKCSDEGKLRTAKVTKLLVENGYTIVSGLATGVDTVALETAIKCGGRVIAVIGTPIDEYYPKENKALQDEIAKNHLLISQVPFYRYANEAFTTRRHYFPRRNATMSAISSGTVIVEASDTSGTLTQARAAMHQKRNLFILNSCFENKALKWPLKYEKQGAVRVRNPEDILTVLNKGNV